MTYVLLIVFVVNTVSSQVIEFPTRESCERAAERIQNWNYVRSTICISRGEEV